MASPESYDPYDDDNLALELVDSFCSAIAGSGLEGLQGFHGASGNIPPGEMKRFLNEESPERFMDYLAACEKHDQDEMEVLQSREREGKGFTTMTPVLCVLAITRTGSKYPISDKNSEGYQMVEYLFTKANELIEISLYTIKFLDGIGVHPLAWEFVVQCLLDQTDKPCKEISKITIGVLQSQKPSLNDGILDSLMQKLNNHIQSL